jgi:hypothetical protein
VHAVSELRGKFTEKEDLTMKREETRTVTTCDFCGKEIHGDPHQSPETSFTTADLDYFHGIWMGDVGDFYKGSSVTGGRKDFCNIECLFGDIRSAHWQLLAKKKGETGNA